MGAIISCLAFESGKGIGAADFDDYTLSSPAISEGQIFIRTTSGLWAIGKRAAN